MSFHSERLVSKEQQLVFLEVEQLGKDIRVRETKAMFTGLIAEQGKVKEIRRNQQMIQLTFQASNSILSDYKIGDSMAVNGVCLTAIEVSSTFLKLK